MIRFSYKLDGVLDSAQPVRQIWYNGKKIKKVYMGDALVWQPIISEDWMPKRDLDYPVATKISSPTHTIELVGDGQYSTVDRIGTSPLVIDVDFMATLNTGTVNCDWTAWSQNDYVGAEIAQIKGTIRNNIGTIVSTTGWQNLNIDISKDLIYSAMPMETGDLMTWRIQFEPSALATAYNSVTWISLVMRGVDSRTGDEINIASWVLRILALPTPSAKELGTK